MCKNLFIALVFSLPISVGSFSFAAEFYLPSKTNLSSRKHFSTLINAEKKGNCSKVWRQGKKLGSNYVLADIAFFKAAHCFAEKAKWSKVLQAAALGLQAGIVTSSWHRRLLVVKGLALAKLSKQTELVAVMQQLQRPREKYQLYGNQELQRLSKIVQALPKTEAESWRRWLYLTFVALSQDANAAGIIDKADPYGLWPAPDFVLDLARAYLFRKDYRRAIELFSTYYVRSGDYDVLWRMSRIYKTLGKSRDQERVLQEKIEKAPDRYQRQMSWLQLGRFHWNRDYDDKANQAFTTAWNIKPKSDVAIAANYYYGRVIESHGNFRGAEAIQLRSLDIEPKQDFARARKLESLMRAAWLARKQRYFLRAERTYKTALQADRYNSRRGEILFWLAVCVRQQGREAEAKKWFSASVEATPYDYYGIMAAKEAGIAFAPIQPPPQFDAELADRFSESDWLFVERYFELKACDLKKEARSELGLISWSDKNEEQLIALARLYQLGGRYHRALRLAKFAIRYNEGKPRAKWLPFLYPRPHWPKVHRFAMLNGIDPYLLLAIMRQESEFNAEAVSRADAYGLMQILPSLARSIGPEIGLHLAKPQNLFESPFNIRLAAFHLGQLMDKYDDNIVFTLGAYNASEGAVAKWRRRFKDLDLVAFVEEIPYGETKGYVKKVTRNLQVYNRLFAN